LVRESRVLPRSFYAREAETVARGLVGKILVHERTAGRIVETEAYLGMGDLAAHASHGLMARTRVIFGPPGHAYVYLIYGNECLNVVAEPAGTPGCVLIRAIDPLVGIERMRRRRPAARRIEPGIRARQVDAGAGCHAAALRRGCDAGRADGSRVEERAKNRAHALT
jgi:DNA-3-methyladenine glycosylase